MSTVPSHPPIGLVLTQTSRVASRVFDYKLAAVGGSLPVWLVLLALTKGPARSQVELAAEIGIRGATLSHHLDGMESAGLVSRRPDPDNRRLHLVELTPAGTELFGRLRETAMAHDRRLREGLSDAEVAQLAGLLDRLRRNAGAAG